MIDEETLKELALKMTGHTDDIGEAFEQWDNERSALVETFALALEQEKLLKKLEENWGIIRRVLYGNAAPLDVSKYPSLPDENSLARFVVAVRYLDHWKEEVGEAESEKVRVETYYQPVLFKLTGSVSEEEVQDGDSSNS